MIILKISDGLGNQLFQYANGKSLVKHKKQSLLCDLSWYNEIHDNFTKRSFKLNKFNVVLNEANHNLLDKIKRSKLPIVIRSFYWRTQNRLPYYKKHIVKEQSFTYDPNILKCKNDVYLEGFWQSEKYFNKIRPILLKEIQLKEDITENRYYKQIKQTENPISIHVRRGDYTKTDSEHLTLSLEYYVKGINYINNRKKNISFYIFSDDIEWVKKQSIFTKIEATFIENQKEEVDLMLMSKCKHNIIANSSFSWWGAWLNQNNDKIVIAPSRWFKNEKIDILDLIPENWIKI